MAKPQEALVSRSRRPKTDDNIVTLRGEPVLGLSDAATGFVSRYPKEARMAVAAALEAAAVQVEAGNDADDDTSDCLRPSVVRKSPGPELINVSQAAERLGISRTTVYEWLGKQKLLGWETTRRGHLIPAEQIFGRGQVLKGVSELLQIINDPELAWAFLSQEWPFADDFARPIDKLKDGEVDEVLDAAPGFGTAFS